MVNNTGSHARRKTITSIEDYQKEEFFQNTSKENMKQQLCIQTIQNAACTVLHRHLGLLENITDQEISYEA